MDEELGNKPPLPLDLTLSLVKGMAEEQDGVPSPTTPMPMESPQLPPSTTPFTQEGPHLKSQPNHLLVNPSPDPNQDQKKDQIQWTTPAYGPWQRLTGLEVSTLTDGKN